MGNRTTKILLMCLLVFSTWMAVKPLTVHACSCAASPSIEDQLDRKTAVFTGKVLSLTKPVEGKTYSSADPVKVQFEVKTVWKGELSSQTIVYTAVGSESCGYDGFTVNEEFIVFAYGDPDRLETGLCEGNKTSASAHEELAALGTGYEPMKLALPQKVSSGVSPPDEETDTRFLAIMSVLAVSLTLFILLVILLRRRRR